MKTIAVLLFLEFGTLGYICRDYGIWVSAMMFASFVIGMIVATFVVCEDFH